PANPCGADGTRTQCRPALKRREMFANGTGVAASPTPFATLGCFPSRIRLHDRPRRDCSCRSVVACRCGSPMGYRRAPGEGTRGGPVGCHGKCPPDRCRATEPTLAIRLELGTGVDVLPTDAVSEPYTKPWW